MDARHEAELHCPYSLVLDLDQTDAMIKFEPKGTWWNAISFPAITHLISVGFW